MQIALQDIRILGYKKIAKYFIDDKSDFFNSIQSLNNLFYNLKIPAYSLLNKWKAIDDNLSDEDKSSNMRGYYLFVNNLEPLISFEDNPSVSAKRKCRNMWNFVWDTFGQVLGLEEYQLTLLKDFGLKIAFIYAGLDTEFTDIFFKLSEEHPGSKDLVLRLLEFYNIILIWSVFCQQESNFTKNNLNPIEVLNILVLSSKSEFETILYNIY